MSYGEGLSGENAVFAHIVKQLRLAYTAKDKTNGIGAHCQFLCRFNAMYVVYNVGGYKLNIVPYTISKLITQLPKGYCLDYELIWKKQELYPALNYEIERLARITNEFIQQSGGVIVTEYCKKEDTWKKYRDIPYQFSKAFLSTLINKDIIEAKTRAETKDNKLTADINIEAEIVRLGGPYWRNLLEEGLKRRLLSHMEVDLLNIAASIDTPMPKIASPKQAKLIWKIREKLANAGVLV